LSEPKLSAGFTDPSSFAADYFGIDAFRPHNIDLGEHKYVVERKYKKEIRVWPRPIT
jgi:hypothetical protein